MTALPPPTQRRPPSQLLIAPKPQAAPPSTTSRAVARIDDSADSAGMRGWMIIAVFFGLIGTWALLAPLNGAVIADAVVTVDGHRRPVQHAEGGIVHQLLVREGDVVTQGQPLVVMDDGEVAAGFQILDETVLVLRASEARLEAELRQSAGLTLPTTIAARQGEARVLAIWRDQEALFQARRSEQQGELRISSERMGQLSARIRGTTAQLVSLETQDKSLRRELASLRPLLAKGIVTRQRLLELERTIANLAGQIGQATATLAGAEQAVSEQRQLGVQTRLQRSSAVAQELRDTRLRLAEVVPKLATAKASLNRATLRAPAAGVVVGLGAYAPGTIVGRGDRVMEIVPDKADLVVEARIAIADIAAIAVGALAEVRLTGYGQKSTPPLEAAIAQISADRLTDQRSGVAYYSAILRVAPDAVTTGTGQRIMAGMGASVTIPTTSRTALQYIVDPLRQSFNKALREK